MRGSYEELNCPFCDKGTIQAWYIPSIWGDKRTEERNRLGEEINRIDGQIDQKVYELYGLTKEEVKIIKS